MWAYMYPFVNGLVGRQFVFSNHQILLLPSSTTVNARAIGGVCSSGYVCMHVSVCSFAFLFNLEVFINC